MNGDKSNLITKTLYEIFNEIPKSNLNKSNTPFVDAQKVINTASLKAAAVSGVAALPPGPFGFATIAPELYTVWKIQAQMVADVCALYGQNSHLTQESMIYCLFRHGSGHLFNDVVIRIGERALIKRASLKFMQSILEKIGMRVTQRVISKSITRFLPFVGAVTLAGYAKYDTSNVGKNAIDLFKSQIEFQDKETEKKSA